MSEVEDMLEKLKESLGSLEQKEMILPNLKLSTPLMDIPHDDYKAKYRYALVQVALANTLLRDLILGSPVDQAHYRVEHGDWLTDALAEITCFMNDAMNEFGPAIHDAIENDLIPTGQPPEQVYKFIRYAMDMPFHESIQDEAREVKELIDQERMSEAKAGFDRLRAKWDAWNRERSDFGVGCLGQQTAPKSSEEGDGRTYHRVDGGAEA